MTPLGLKVNADKDLFSQRCVWILSICISFVTGEATAADWSRQGKVGQLFSQEIFH